MTRLLAVPLSLAVAAPLAGVANTTDDAHTLAQLQKALDNDHYKTAEQQSSAYLEAHPGNRDARFIHAAALAGQKENKAAIKAFSALHADFPSRVEPANDLAVLYAREGHYDKARQWLEKAMATQPAYATAHQNLGDVYTALADTAYSKALDTDEVAKKVALKMVDRFYYAGESVASDASTAATRNCPTPQPQEKPAKTASTDQSPAAPTDHTSSSTTSQSTADATQAVLDTMHAWARAWSAQDVDAYLDFYADDFTPADGRGLEHWRRLRRKRLTAPEKIQIEIDKPSVTLIDKHHAKVEFRQKYSSPRYSDRVTKQLSMSREDGQWRITREQSS